MENILERLYDPFTADLIKTRKGPRNMDLSYIESHEVINRLNDVLGLSWDFEITGSEVHNERVQIRKDGEVVEETVATVVVFGTLTVAAVSGDGDSADYRHIKRSQCGTHVNRDGYENSFKAAASDCLKKCATLFGVALHLYGSGTPKKTNSASQESVPSSTTTTPQDGQIERSATEKQVKFIKALADKCGRAEKKLDVYKELAGGITAARASTMIEFLKEMGEGPVETIKVPLQEQAILESRRLAEESEDSSDTDSLPF